MVLAIYFKSLSSRAQKSKANARPNKVNYCGDFCSRPGLGFGSMTTVAWQPTFILTLFTSRLGKKKTNKTCWSQNNFVIHQHS